MQKIIVADNVSMCFNLASERVDSLKDLLIKKIKFQSCSFDEFWALNNISFSVDKGESCALIGANGSGKSTMLKIISGILTPTKGSVEVNGSIAPLIELGAGFDYELTGRENIFLNGAILGYSKKLMLEKYDEIIDFSELRDFIDVPVKNYSSGMIARLGFSIATMVKPEILVVDEILAVGDQAFQDKCHKRLEDMMNSGTTYTGAKLVVIPKQLFSFPVKLIEFMNEARINTIYWVPSAMNMIANFKALDEHRLPFLKTVLFAGEAMPTKQLNYWRRHLSADTLYANLFGPTETTDIAVYYIIDRDFRDDEPIPIGHACRNCDVFVLKEDDTLAGADEEGELCVRGSFLASGYYDNPEKTGEVFVQNPLNTHYRDMIYKTGDLVKYNDRGELVYITRKDFQIKHQGYRIELGEIETAVSAVSRVHECACIYDLERKLIIIYCSGQNLTSKDILLGVRDRLPKYMLPNKMFFLENMPHNANGKIDKKMLQKIYENEMQK